MKWQLEKLRNSDKYFALSNHGQFLTFMRLFEIFHLHFKQQHWTLEAKHIHISVHVLLKLEHQRNRIEKSKLLSNLSNMSLLHWPYQLWMIPSSLFSSHLLGSVKQFERWKIRISIETVKFCLVYKLNNFVGEVTNSQVARDKEKMTRCGDDDDTLL